MEKMLQIILILSIVINVSACKNQTKEKTVMNFSKNDKKYEFNVAACAPNLYPAEIIDGAFSLADGTSQYIPSGAVLKTGWGGLAPTHVSGSDAKSLPIGFNITWVSYIEKKFYRGAFQLDNKHITDLFNKGFKNERNEQQTFNEVKVGLAPGGVVVVWLNGNGTQIEVGRFIAKKIEVTKDYFIPNATVSVDAYIEETIKEDLPEQYQNSNFRDNIPFGMWDEYRKKLIWKPSIIFANDKSEVVSMVIYYFNGEKIFTSGKNKELTDFKERAIPKYISIIWKDKNNNSFGSRIQFGRIYEDDEDLKVTKKELFDVFKTIYSKSNQAEFVVKIDKYNSNLNLFLASEKDTIPLKKSKVKVYMKTKK